MIELNKKNNKKMKKFHHIGMPSDKKKPGEDYVEKLKVWVVSPDSDPHRIEWVRFDVDSPLLETPLAKMPHVAWQVDDLDKELRGRHVVFGPIQVEEDLRVVFFIQNDALIEYMQCG